MVNYLYWFVYYYGKKEVKINCKMGYVIVFVDELKVVI